MFDTRVAKAVQAEVETASFDELRAAAASVGPAQGPRTLAALRAKLRSAIMAARRHSCVVLVDAAHQGPSLAFRDAHGGLVVECSPPQAAALNETTPLTLVSVKERWRATYRPIVKASNDRAPANFLLPPWDIPSERPKAE